MKNFITILVCIAVIYFLYIKIREFSRQPRIDDFVVVSGYKVKIKYENGLWVSPFVTKNGHPIKRESKTQIRASIKGCIKKTTEFGGQFNDLLSGENPVITVFKEKEKGD